MSVGLCPCGDVAVAVGVAVNVGVNVKVAVGGPDVKVAVGAWELWRVIRGVTQREKSSCDEPFASTYRMNFTFSPFRVLRSMLMG